MKKQMINRFLLLFAHPTSIDQHHIFLPQIVQGKNFAKSSRPHKKRRPRKGFSTPNTLPRKMETDRQSKNSIEGSHLKLSPPIRNPLNFVSPITQIIRIQEAIERCQIIYFPIIQRSHKTNIPLMRTTHRIKIIRDGSLLVASQTIQPREHLQKRQAATPRLPPKVDFGPVTRNKSNMIGKMMLFLANKLPQAPSMRTLSNFETPPPSL